MRNICLILFSLAVAGLTWLSADITQACRRTTPVSLDEICLKADAIVVATAVKYLELPVGNIRQLNTPGNVEIQFDTTDVLKGRNLPESISLNGYLTDVDDFNDRPVPYDFVRPGGRGGSCFAYEYKQGAKFLLFLKKIDGRLTINWDALSPVNEQLKSSEDESKKWVEQHLRRMEKNR